MKRTRLTIIALACITGLVIVPPVRADDTTAKPTAEQPPKPPAKPTPKKPEKDPAQAILTDAIAKLTAEYREARKSDGVRRTELNYFETPPAELTPEKVVAAISRQVASDPSSDAYVRWQLLSAVPSTFDEKLSGKVLAIYRAAPKPSLRLGVSANDRRELEKALRGKSGAAGADQINQQFDAARAKRDVGNQPIYAFRDTLLSKLPSSAEVINGAIADAVDRFRTGDIVAGGNAMKNIQLLVATWAISVEGSRPKMAVAEMVERLRREPGVEYADKVVADPNGQLRWQVGNSKPSSGSLDNILDSMKGSAAFGGAAK